MKRPARHTHPGFSSEGFLDSEGIVSRIDLKRDQSVLDVGCGEGHFSLAAADIVGDQGQVIAVDIHEPSINILKRIIAQENIGNILVFSADVTKRIPANDNAIDVCMMVNVLHGFVLNGEVSDVMREIVRVIKRHGSLVIVDFKKTETVAGPPVSQRLSPADVEEIVSYYGFMADKFDDVGPYSYLYNFIKR
jgi:ubiquinone/menaquinone biosynthesis C-methylase UbiE